jgi:hypothetical protein
MSFLTNIEPVEKCLIVNPTSQCLNDNDQCYKNIFGVIYSVNLGIFATVLTYCRKLLPELASCDYFLRKKIQMPLSTHFYLKTSGGQNFNLFLNVVPFFNTSFN